MFLTCSLANLFPLNRKLLLMDFIFSNEEYRIIFLSEKSQLFVKYILSSSILHSHCCLSPNSPFTLHLSIPHLIHLLILHFTTLIPTVILIILHFTTILIILHFIPTILILHFPNLVLITILIRHSLTLLINFTPLVVLLPLHFAHSSLIFSFPPNKPMLFQS